VEEGGQLHGGDVEAVAVFLEAAASAGHFADRAAAGDLIGEIGIDAVDGGVDVRSLRGVVDGVADGSDV
jgi:hypothetical protein